METWQVIALGCAGGALPDVLRVIERRHEPPPEYLWRGFFWVSLGLLVCLGGAAGYLLSPTRVIDALAIGFSAPSLVAGLLAQKPERPEPESRESPAGRTPQKINESRESKVLRTIKKISEKNGLAVGGSMVAPFSTEFAKLRTWWGGDLPD